MRSGGKTHADVANAVLLIAMASVMLFFTLFSAVMAALHH
jgi:hypothetical protein